jgi:hypothetical protein
VQGCGGGRLAARSRAGLLLVVAVAIVALPACSATVGIGVVAKANGTGAVSVTVTLDQQAVAAVGDLSAQLQSSDLVAAGWQVSTPAPGPDGSEVLRASYPFSSLAEVGPIVEQVAGSGPPASRPFQFLLTRDQGFWTTVTRFQATVDLTCGLGCFGDPGLAHQLGTSTGINPAVAQRQTGTNPAQVFHFQVTVRLPAGPLSTNATARLAGSLGWQPALGRTSRLFAVTRSVNVGAVAAAAAGGALLLVALVAVVVVLIRRRRGRGQRAGHRRGAHAKGA